MIRKLTKKQQEQPKGGSDGLIIYGPGDWCLSYCETFCVTAEDAKINKYNSNNGYNTGQDPYRQTI